ncbi:hypothetical protein HPB48_007277 [Haemaphysalis longicornis]|uniref:Uncharacterized protein n=1 Tax=Haemaphysalis longicornis TaxID=44386 RepID=A0A9J6F9N4_HAELO|nr:hypothetical protein HPB48_007277 [Haemaphysalis longicornis]
MQDALQQAAGAVRQYASARSLECSPEKSELIILRRKARGKPLEPTTIQIKLQGSDIPVVPTFRILGLYIQQDGGGTLTIQRLNRTALQIICMDHVIKLVKALVVSRVVYSTPYVQLKPRYMAKLDILLRKAYRQALGLSPHTNTIKREALGTHNWVRQLERLKQASNGHTVLRQLAYRIADASHPRPETVPPDIPRSSGLLRSREKSTLSSPHSAEKHGYNSCKGSTLTTRMCDSRTRPTTHSIQPQQ